MQPVPLIRVRALGPLLRHLEQCEIPLPPVLGPAQALLGDDNRLLPLSVGGELWERAARQAGQPDLGLSVGAASPLADASDLGQIVARSVTIGAAFEATVRGASRFNSGQRFWQVEHGDETTLHWRYAPALQRGRRQVNEYVLMLVVELVRRAAGKSWRPLEVHCEGAPPPHAERLAALALRRVRWAQASMAIVVPRSVLALALPGAREALPQAEDPLPDPEFAGSVRQTVGSLLRMGAPLLPAAADAAGMSVRSFQRRLETAGLRFGELVQQCRFEAACRLLREPGAKVVAVSAELGYTDSANFTRAFRRWAGVPPQEFRRRALRDGAQSL
jgi:AraC-like DNA-binding protein